jgi:hypothetical protein
VLLVKTDSNHDGSELRRSHPLLPLFLVREVAKLCSAVSQESSLSLQPNFVICGRQSTFLFEACVKDGCVILGGISLHDVHARATNALPNHGSHVTAIANILGFQFEPRL